MIVGMPRNRIGEKLECLISYIVGVLRGRKMIDVRHLSGTQFQGWNLSHVLGAGADGVVYVGTKGAQEAAVKIFFPEVLAKNGVEGAKERLELQLALNGKKHHPNLVEIFEGGEAFGTLYLVMERVPGQSLDKVISVLPREAIPSLVRQLASAAKFLELRSLVHRDIKPANIVVSDDFSHLTLLDLGIVFDASLNNDDRLSGNEFVATLRYSPWEFVWRKEDGSDAAWRAITFYQIGGTLHDMIMRKPLFDGHDQPRATLYESVKIRTPTIDASDCQRWLIDLAKCCLIKNWRERGQLVSWENFEGPPSDDLDFDRQKKMIKLRQLRNDEIRIAKELDGGSSPRSSRVSDLWDLQDKVFMETRQFLMGAQIFPKFSGTHERIDDRHYKLRFAFESNQELMFENKIVVEVALSVAEHYEAATELEVIAMLPDGGALFDGKWTEMLTVESASAIIRQSLIQVADSVVPQV